MKVIEMLDQKYREKLKTMHGSHWDVIKRDAAARKVHPAEVMYMALKIIHEVLTDHVDYLDELLQDAGRMLDETCAQHEADAEQGDKEAGKAIDEAEARRVSIRTEWNEARAALEEFETQDWS